MGTRTSEQAPLVNPLDVTTAQIISLFGVYDGRDGNRQRKEALPAEPVISNSEVARQHDGS